jgi:hypothetical protein
MLYSVNWISLGIYITFKQNIYKTMNKTTMNNNTIYLLLGFLIALPLGMLPYEGKILGLTILFFIFLSLILIQILTYQNKSLTTLKVLETNHDVNMRCLKFTMSNNNYLEGENLFKGIYQTLMDNEQFINFGFNKIIILSVTLSNNREYNVHSNTLIANDTTFEDYYLFVSTELSNYNNLQYGYHNEEILKYNVLCWNADDIKNSKIKQTHNTLLAKGVSPKIKNIKKQGFQTMRTFTTSAINNAQRNWFKGLIKSISLVTKKGILKQKYTKPIFTMDLETINLNGVEVVIAISSCGFFNHKLDVQIFLIDHILLQNNPELALQQLWNKYFTYLKNVIDVEVILEGKLTVFAHNLGNFDGYFLYKGLMLCYNPDHVTCIMDESNSFISIQHINVPYIEWKDSLRIFPISLNKLCKMFVVDGKTAPYNPQFNSINLFNNPELLQLFVEYSLQDAKALYQALSIAQSIYFDKFKVDIESVYSTATLSLKIFRTVFQDKPIYILPYNIDSFIRTGYFGGGTDVYKAYAKNVYYYDVNSLYPYAMLNPMPYNILNNGKMIDLSNKSLDSFFGFALVKIFCPLNMARPVLSFHYEGKTIYPVGNWIGVYFSEELKAVSKLGYQITLIKGYEFTKTDLFSGYIKHFYEIKKNSSGVERNMAKLQLNNLYGYFGRKQIGLITQNVKNIELNNILSTRVVKSITPINTEYTTVLSYSNINHTLIEKLNVDFQSIGSPQHYIMSNVALAAAVTAYARITMIPFKIDSNTLYTDTDSIFTTRALNPFNWFPIAADVQSKFNTFLDVQFDMVRSDRKLYPFTENNPYDGWLTKLRKAYVGESNVEFLERTRLAFNADRVYEYLRVSKGKMVDMGGITPIWSAVTTPSYLTPTAVGLHASTSSLVEHVNSIVTSTKLASISPTPSVVPTTAWAEHIVENTEEGFEAMKKWHAKNLANNSINQGVTKTSGWVFNKPATFAEVVGDIPVHTNKFSILSENL